MTTQITLQNPLNRRSVPADCGDVRSHQSGSQHVPHRLQLTAITYSPRRFCCGDDCAHPDDGSRNDDCDSADPPNSYQTKLALGNYIIRQFIIALAIATFLIP